MEVSRRQRPARVDGDAMATLDDLARRLKTDPLATIQIVGYGDGEHTSLAGERALDTKAYLDQRQGIDPNRIEVQTTVGRSRSAGIRWIA